jgi:hypothetical protein
VSCSGGPRLVARFSQIEGYRCFEAEAPYRSGDPVQMDHLSSPSPKMLRKPNFFIIGAPKCGTTSFWTWLSSHPNIFVTPEKEPHFSILMTPGVA